MSAIFISHSSTDHAAAAEINTWLKEQGHRSVFLDFNPEQGIPPGRDWEQELYRQLRSSQAVIVLCSQDSMASHWCFAEITHAKALGKPIFPIKIGECIINTVLTARQVLDLTKDPEEAYRRLWRGLKSAGLDPADAFDWDGSRPPYPGLLAFQEEDAAVFFGRSVEIQQGLELLNRLRQFGGARTVMVLGASGSGKSSLVRAGLLPRLRKNEQQWLVTHPFRPQERPLQELAIVLAEAFKAHGEERDWKELREKLEQAARADPVTGDALIELAQDLRIAAGQREAVVLLVIDQMEELLGDTGVVRFLPLLRAALDAPGSPLMAIGTLRSDFLGDFQQHPATQDFAFEDLRVGPMSVDRLAQVIEGPAEKAGLTLEAGLTEAMIQDTATDDALPLLAFALRELYERHGSDGRLTVEEYRDRLGGLGGSVAKAADAVVAAKPLTEAEEADLRNAFLAMVRINEEGHYARQAAYERDLPEQVHPLLERFVQARLLIARGEGDGRILEVAHEALFRSWGRLRSWLDQDREFLLWLKRVREALREWERTGYDASALLTGPALAEGQSWEYRKSARLLPEERTFIQASIKAETVRRQRRMLGVAASFVFLLAVAVVVFGFWQQAETAAEESNRRAHVSMAQALAAEAPRQRTQQREDERAALLARQALRLNDEHRGHVFNYIDNTLREVFRQPFFSRILRDDGTEVTAVAFSLDGQRLAAGREDGRIRLWNLQDLYADTVFLDVYQGTVTAVAFSPDGKRLASGSRAGVVQVLNLDRPDDDPLSLPDHEDAVLALAFSPDGTTLASGGADETVRLWDLAADRLTRRVAVEGDARIESMAFSPDGKNVVVGRDDGRVHLWDLESTRVDSVLGEAVLHPWALALNWNGNSLAAGYEDGSVRLWNRSEGLEEPVILTGHQGPVHSLAFSLYTNTMATGGKDGTVRLWDLAEQPANPTILRGGAYGVKVAFSADGKTLAASSEDEVVRLWDVDTGRIDTVALDGYQGTITATAYNPDGKTLAWGSRDGLLKLRPVADANAETTVLEGHEGTITALTFSRDGAILASGGGDATVRVWDLEDADADPVILEGHQGKVTAVALNRNRGVLASGDEGGTVRLWKLGQDGAEPVVLGSSIEGELHAVAFSPDGAWLAAGSEDGRVRVWDVTRPRAEAVFQDRLEESVYAVTFSPDGKRLAVGSKDETVRVWDWTIRDADPIVFRDLGDWITSVAFSPDGRRLAAGGQEGDVFVWMTTEALADRVCEVVSRNLTQAEWRQFIGDDIPYEHTCGDAVGQ